MVIHSKSLLSIAGASKRCRSLFLLSFIASLLCTSCERQERATPKPRSYPRIDYPERQYVAAALDYCPFGFDRSKASIIEKKELFFGERPLNDCWFNLFYPDLNGRIYFSYSPIADQVSFDKLQSDAFKITYKHSQRANAIDEVPISSENRTATGFRFDVAGASASPVQFYLTDSTNHFLRASLYIESQVNRDSLQPIIEYISEDIDHIIKTLEWK